MLGADLSNEFDVKVGLRQGSVLSPVLFNVVMELISGKIGGDALGKLLYADDLAVMASDGKELEEVLRRWQAEFRRHGLNPIYTGRFFCRRTEGGFLEPPCDLWFALSDFAQIFTADSHGSNLPTHTFLFRYMHY